MVIPSDPFHRLLEHYLFGAASKFIHLANPDEQNQLIGLINLVNANMDSLASVASPVSAEVSEEPVLVELSVADDHWLVVCIRRQVKRHETYIHHLEKAIRITETHAQYIDYRFHVEPARSAMLERNKHMLAFYQRHLAEMRSNQSALHHKLKSLTTRLCFGKQ